MGLTLALRRWAERRQPENWKGSPGSYLWGRVARIWLALLLATLASAMLSNPSSLTHLHIAWGCWVLFVLTWFVTLVRPWLPTIVLVAVAALTCVVISATTGQFGTYGGTYRVSNLWLFASGVAIAMLLLRMRSAVVVILIMFVLSFIAVPLSGEVHGIPDTVTWVAEQINIVTLTMALVAGVSAEEEVSSDYVRRRRGAAFAAATAARARQYAARSAARARTLHDTVVNTLGVVARGVPRGYESALRDRAEYDVRRLDVTAITDPGDAGPAPTLDDLAMRVAVRGIALGLDMTWNDQDVLDDRPMRPETFDLVSAASSEALLNADKHSGSSAVAIHLDGDSVQGTLSITDYGSGVTGLAEQLSEWSPLRDVPNSGVHITVTSSPEAGTSITITWAPVRRPEPTLRAQPGALSRQVRPRMMLWMAIWTYSGALVASFALAITTNVAGDLAALALAVGASTWSLGIALRGRPVPGLALLLVLIPAVTWLPVIGLRGCAQIGPNFWAPNVGVVLVILVILLAETRHLQYAAAGVFIVSSVSFMLAVWTLTPGCAPNGASSTASYIIPVLLFVALRVFLDDREQQSRELTAQLVSSEAVAADIIEQYVLADPSRSAQMLDPGRELLSSLATGRVDSHDPMVRTMATREESYLRAALAVQDGLDGLGPVIVPIVAAAREARILLHVGRGGSPQHPPSPQVRDAVTIALCSLIRACAPDTLVRITLFTGDGNQISAVTDAPVEIATIHAGDHLAVDVDDLAGQVLVTITW